MCASNFLVAKEKSALKFMTRNLENLIKVGSELLMTLTSVRFYTYTTTSIILISANVQSGAKTSVLYQMLIYTIMTEKGPKSQLNLKVPAYFLVV